MYTLNPDAIDIIMGWLKDDAEGPRALKHQTLLLIADLQRQVAEATARAEKAEAKNADLEDQIEQWKVASGLERGGDPDPVTPDDLERDLAQREAERDRLERQLVTALEAIIYYAGWFATGGRREGWYDSRGLCVLMDAGDQLVALGRWERHPDGDGRRHWYRPKVKEKT